MKLYLKLPRRAAALHFLFLIIFGSSLLSVQPILAQTTVAVVAIPSIADATVGVPFTVTIQMQAVSVLHDGTDVFLTFDPAVLQIQSITSAPGNQLNSELLIAYCNQGVVGMNCATVGNTAGRMRASYGRLSGFASGTYDLVTITILPLTNAVSTAINFSTTAPRRTRVIHSTNGDVTGTLTHTSVAIPFPVVELDLAALSVPENGGGSSVRLSRTGVTTNALNVSVTLTQGTGMLGSDYTVSGGSISAQSGSATVTIDAGNPFVDIGFAPIEDVIAEPDNILTLQLVDTSSYELGAITSSTLTIEFNDLGVTTTTDSVEGSLRQAVMNANTFGGGEVIAPSGTYTLTGGSLEVNSDLTLTGNTVATTTINGNGDRALNISGGTVLLRGFTLTGGGVEISGGVVTIGNDPVFITGNNTTVCGGGVEITGGTTTIGAGSHINNNTTTDHGGGICVTGGALTVTGSGTQVNGNTANGNGGGIYVNGGSAIVQNGVDINGNTSVNGGGIYHLNGDLDVTGSYIQQNIGTTGVGGAIFFGSSGTPSVSSSCIVLNTDPAVSFGGAVTTATNNWWGSAAGPYSGTNLPNPPNDDNTATSYGDSVSLSPGVSLFDYSGYQTTAPSGCFACTVPSAIGAVGRNSRVCLMTP